MNFRLSVVALALVVLGPGCMAKPSGTVEIFAACSPPAPDTASKACIYPTGHCDTVPLGTYALDVAVAPAMAIALEVHNQLPDNTNKDTGHQNTNNAYIDTYEVSYSAPFAIPGVSGSIQNVVPSEGSDIVLVELVRDAAMTAIATAVTAGGPGVEISAEVKLKGKLGDQSSFETAPRRFGIVVCNAGFCVAPLPACTTGTPIACPWAGQSPAMPGCSGSGGGSTGFTVGGQITNLGGTGLVLRLNGTTDVVVPFPSSTYDFTTTLNSGASYSITVVSSPSGQTCTVSNASGTVGSANVTNADVNCI